MTPDSRETTDDWRDEALSFLPPTFAYGGVSLSTDEEEDDDFDDDEDDDYDDDEDDDDDFDDDDDDWDDDLDD